MRKSFALGLILICAGPAAAESGAARAQFIAPFLDEQTYAVAHIDLGRLNVDAAMDEIVKLTPLGGAAFRKAQRELKDAVGRLSRAGVRDIYLVFSLADQPMEPPFIVVPLPEPNQEAARKQVVEAVRRLSGRDLGALIIKGQAVSAPRRTLERLRTQQAHAFPELAEAFAAAGDTAAQVVLLVPPYTRRIVEETMPTLPREIGGGPSKVLTQGIHWAVVAADLPPKISLRLVIQSHDAAAAHALGAWLTARLQQAVRLPPIYESYPQIGKLAVALIPGVRGDRVVIRVDRAIIALLAPAAAGIEMARARMQSSNNFKQILLAFHNYHDVNKHFPAYAITSKEGKPLLSWRVAILPYIDEEALYREFHLDEPWDSEHNKKLIARMPSTYVSSPGLAGQHKTTYLGVRGKHMMFPDDHGVTIREVTDGTSNTIGVVDVNDDHAVIWTKPEDFRPDPRDPVRGLVGHFKHVFLAGFVDGSVHTLADTIKPAVLHALFTRDGGEVIDSTQY